MSERVEVPFLRVSGRIACGPVPAGRVPGASLPTRPPKDHDEFVQSEVVALVKQRFLVKWTDVTDLECPTGPTLVLPLWVEPSEPRLVIDARALDYSC